MKMDRDQAMQLKKLAAELLLWLLIALIGGSILGLMLIKTAGSFINAIFYVSLIFFFGGLYGMSRGNTQDFNPWSYLGSRCVQSMQDPGNNKYALRHMEESTLQLNVKGVALTAAGVLLFLLSILL